MEKTSKNHQLGNMSLDLKIEKAKLIINEVNRYFNVQCQTLGRKGYVVLPRQMAMYYIKKHLELSLNEIGKLFPSNKSISKHIDHSTVIHANKTISNLLEYDKEIKGFDKDLNDVCYSISLFSEKEYQKHVRIQDIVENLKKTDLDDLVKIGKYITHRYINIQHEEVIS